MSSSSKTNKRKGKVPLRTRQEAREWLQANGISISSFERQHGLGKDSVRDILSGASKGNWGQSHRAAVALGIKAGPDALINSPNVPRTGKADK